MRGRGRGRASGGYQRHLPPRLLRQSRADTGEEESLACRDVQAPQVGIRPRMKGDGGRAASLGEASKLRSLGEASKLKYSKKESLEKASRLKYSKAEDRAGKAGGLEEKVQQNVWTGRVVAVGDRKPCNEEMQRRGGGEGGNLKLLEDQVQALEKQLKDERMEQKKFLEVLTNVINGEVPCVALENAENILVIEQLQDALAAVESSGTEIGQTRASTKLKDRNDNKLVVNNLVQEQRGAEEGSKIKDPVSGGWYVVEKRGRRKPNSNPPSSYHHRAKVSPAATPVRWVPGGRDLLPTPPPFASNFHTRRNPMY